LLLLLLLLLLLPHELLLRGQKLLRQRDSSTSRPLLLLLHLLECLQRGVGGDLREGQEWAYRAGVNRTPFQSRAHRIVLRLEQDSGLHSM